MPLAFLIKKTINIKMTIEDYIQNNYCSISVFFIILIVIYELWTTFIQMENNSTFCFYLNLTSPFLTFSILYLFTTLKYYLSSKLLNLVKNSR
jgi:hypothetical protein